MSTCIIGIDCATDPKRVGLARGRVTADGLMVDRLGKVSKWESVADRVVDWIADENRVLLAMDAPLGWPAALGNALAVHNAGDFLPVAPNQLFRRDTDRFTHRQIGKLPLDVGADRIARTAHAALTLLHEISERRQCAIPLAWVPEFPGPLAAIEVYPAAVLKTSGMVFQGYKGSSQTAQRAGIATLLPRQMTFATDTAILLSDDDVLDAAICVLAGYHFLQGLCIPPTDPDLARWEGWIWFRGG
jgi:predicted RNase H-like nuclease